MSSGVKYSDDMPTFITNTLLFEIDFTGIHPERKINMYISIISLFELTVADKKI